MVGKEDSDLLRKGTGVLGCRPIWLTSRSWLVVPSTRGPPEDSPPSKPQSPLHTPHPNPLSLQRGRFCDPFGEGTGGLFPDVPPEAHSPTPRRETVREGPGGSCPLRDRGGHRTKGLKEGGDVRSDPVFIPPPHPDRRNYCVNPNLHPRWG